MSISCKLWKITLSHDTVDDPTPLIFWAYNFDEPKARSAAMLWAKAKRPGSSISIQKVDLVK